MKNNIHKVWLDCDPGLDDAFAIILAAHHPSIDLLGVSTSAGNTNVENTTRNALDLLHNIGRPDVVVVKGTDQLIAGQAQFAEHIHGEGGFGGVILPRASREPVSENSFEYINNLFAEETEKVIWANTGSLTNLCWILKKYPQIKKKIEKIVIMGGAIGKGNRTPAAEFNIFFDPEAVKQVLQLKGNIPFIMIPLELTHQVRAKQPIFAFLKKYQDVPLAKAIYNLLYYYKELCTKSEGNPHPPVHDPCVIYYLIHPEHIKLQKAIIEVDTYPISYGRTNCYFKNPLEPEKEVQTIDWVGIQIKQKKLFWKYFEDIFTKLFEK